MALTIAHSRDGDTVTMVISGRFEFDAHRQFRDAYRGHDPRAHFVLDLGETEYMDSSALGMLLLLREYAGSENARLSVLNASPAIRRLLEVTRFDRFFRIA